MLGYRLTYHYLLRTIVAVIVVITVLLHSFFIVLLNLLSYSAIQPPVSNKPSVQCTTIGIYQLKQYVRMMRRRRELCSGKKWY